MGFLKDLFSEVPIVGGLLDLAGGERANDRAWEINSANNQFNAEQAQINRDWQHYMTATSYRRAVADMKAAGLNPMLAYSQGGASSGSGSAASAAPSAPVKNTLGPAVATAMQAQQMQAAVEVQEKQAEVLEQEARLKKAQTWSELARPDNIDAHTANLRSGIGVNQTEERRNISSANQMDQQTRNLQLEFQRTEQAIELIKSEIKNTDARTALHKAQEHLSKIDAQYRTGQITLLKFQTGVEEAEEMIRKNLVPGSAQEAKFQSVWGQLTRVIKGLSPITPSVR